AVEEVALEDTQKYGVIDPGTKNGNLIEMKGMVEKPKPSDAPSRYRIIGRYVLQPEIFALLEQQKAGAGGEIQLTDAMATLNQQQLFHATVCSTPIHDCGSKIGWLKANVDMALQRPDLQKEFASFLSDLS
ncbi:MAG: UTP--glucose-1-phosphate uridylyltransferase, partial [Pseudomonadota bacterium]